MIGMLLKDKEKNGKLYEHAFISCIISPILLPIVIGMKIEESSEK